MRTIATSIAPIASSLPVGHPGKNSRQKIEPPLLSENIPVKPGLRGQPDVTQGAVPTVVESGTRSNPAAQCRFMNSFKDGRIKYSMGSKMMFASKDPKFSFTDEGRRCSISRHLRHCMLHKGVL
jgi:hypothetical protein